MNKLAKWLARNVTRLLAFGGLAATGTYLVRVRSLKTMPFAAPKIISQAVASHLVIIGNVAGAIAFALRMPVTGIAAGLTAFLSGRYIKSVTAPHKGFEEAFGPEWEAEIPPNLAERLPRRRYTWPIQKPAKGGEPRFEQNVPFDTVSGANGKGNVLLCDIWQPPEGVEPSGLAFIYFHGSGWHFLDKDTLTRPMFRHLAAQGHVIMDVAYRLCPEVGLQEMVGDVKRALVWMKRHAGEYGVDPNKVVLGGGSAGGNLALLAAYAPYHPELTPDDIKDEELSPLGVVSWYGPTDMHVYNEQAGAALGEPVGQPDLPKPGEDLSAQMSSAMFGKTGLNIYAITHRQMMRNLLGGQPEVVPHMYDLASPVNFVNPECPATLLFQGEHDMFVSAAAVREMHEKLVRMGVPSIYVEFPQTEHAFDLFFPQFAPATQAAMYDLDRFLAYLSAHLQPEHVKATELVVKGIEAESTREPVAVH
jgi:acetyl esterase/lipase